MTTPWSAEDLQAVQAAMAERLGGALQPGERLAVRGESGDGEVFAAFELAGGSSGERFVVEARVELAVAHLDEERGRLLALDALDLTLLEYLESERSERYSGVWETRELRGTPLWVRVERTFPNLEAQAEAWLSGRERPN